MSVSDERRASRGLDRQRVILGIRRSSRPALALLVLTALSLASLAVIVANIGITLPWQSTYARQVAVDDAKGVTPGDPVEIAGITVGRITGVRLVAGHPILDIELAPKDGPLYQNAQLTLRPQTPLDDMYLDVVSRGTPSAGPLGVDEVLPAQRTEVPVDISSVLDVFNADTRARVKEQIDSLGEALGSQGQDFEQALVDLAPFLAAARQLTDQTAIRQTETGDLIHNFELVTSALSARTTEVRDLVANGAASLTATGSHEAAVQAVIDQLPATMSQIESTFATLRSTEGHLDPALVALEPVTRLLPDALVDLTRFSTAATPAFLRLDRPLPVLDSLMKVLSPTAANLNRTLQSLRDVPSQLNTISELVVPCEPALADFFQNTLSVGAYSDNLSTIIRGETILGASSSGSVDDLVAAPSCAPGGAR